MKINLVSSGNFQYEYGNSLYHTKLVCSDFHGLYCDTVSFRAKKR